MNDEAEENLFVHYIEYIIMIMATHCNFYLYVKCYSISIYLSIFYIHSYNIFVKIYGHTAYSIFFIYVHKVTLFYIFAAAA